MESKRFHYFPQLHYQSLIQVKYIKGVNRGKKKIKKTKKKRLVLVKKLLAIKFSSNLIWDRMQEAAIDKI